MVLYSQAVIQSQWSTCDGETLNPLLLWSLPALVKWPHFLSPQSSSGNKCLIWVCVCLSSFHVSLYVQICLHSRFRDTPVVKSSSRELCYIILAGICLGYLCTFSLIAKPHVIHCYLQRLGIGLSPAMSYSALVTKVGTELKICENDMRCRDQQQLHLTDADLLCSSEVRGE